MLFFPLAALQWGIFLMVYGLKLATESSIANDEQGLAG